jgi:hypothetical protein
MSAELCTQKERWGYDRHYVRCVTSDPEGNVLKIYFEPVVGSNRHSAGRRLMTLGAVSASLAAIMALQAVQQALGAG